MSSESPLPAIFDGHNDTLLRLHMAKGEVAPFFEGRKGHLDLPKARAGGFGGGFFAVFVPTPSDEALLDIVDGEGEGEGRKASPQRPKVGWTRDHIPYATSVGFSQSEELAGEVVDLAERLVRESQGQVLWMKTLDDLAEARHDFDSDRYVVAGDSAPLRLVLHFEGAEPIARDCGNLEHWYQRGLRSLGLVWSRRNDFAAGVPFRYPSTPDHFEGLSPAGFELVERCDDLGIMLDLAHLNEKGFWDVSRTSRKPLVVTHSGVLDLCPSSRNLTLDQIKAVRDSDGVIGVNLHCGDLRPDGRLNADTPMEVVQRHIEAIVEAAGVRHVALGSDFDGALMPRGLADASRLPKLLQHLEQAGWNSEDLRRFAYGNWLRALTMAWSR